MQPQAEPPPEEPWTLEKWLADSFGPGVDARDAAAEFRSMLRNAPASERALAVRRLAAIARSAVVARQRSGAEIVLELLDAAADEIGTDDAHYDAAVERGRYELAASRPDRCLVQLARAGKYATTQKRQCDVHYNSGLAWLRLGNVIEAQSHLQAARRLAEGLGDVDGIVHATNLLAHLAVKRNQPRQVADLLEAARRQAELAGRDDLLSYLTKMSGVMYARSGEFARAQEEYRRLSELPDIRDPEVRPRAQAAALSGQIAVHVRQGELAEATRLAPRLRALLDKQGAPERATDMLTLALVTLLNGDLGGSLRECRRAARLAEQEGLRFEHQHALSELALIYALTGAFEPAYRVCAQALEIAEQLRWSAGDIASRLAYTESGTEGYELAVQLCLTLAEIREDPSYREQALSWAERAKSRTLSEFLGLGELPAPPSVPDDLLVAERSAAAQLRAYESVGARAEEVYTEIWRQLETAWAAIAAIAPEYVAIRRGTTIRPGEIHSLLAHAAVLRTAPVPGTAGPPRPAAPGDTEDAGADYAGPREVEVPLPGEPAVRLTIVARRDAASRRQVLTRLSTTAPVHDRLADAVRNLATIDATWWSMFDAAVGAGVVPEAERLGNLLCGCVARWGQISQVRAASAWRNSHLVPEICASLGDPVADQPRWAAARSLLATDRPAAQLCHELHQRHLLPDLPEVDKLIETETGWLDSQFFSGLMEYVRRAAVQGRTDVAYLRFLAGVRAATALAGTPTGVPTAAEWFIEHLPEYRFSPSPPLAAGDPGPAAVTTESPDQPPG